MKFTTQGNCENLVVRVESAFGVIINRVELSICGEDWRHRCKCFENECRVTLPLGNPRVMSPFETTALQCLWEVGGRRLAQLNGSLG